MRLNSIRARMTAAFSISIAILTLISCVGLIWYARRTAEHNAAERLGAAASKVRKELASVQQQHDNRFRRGPHSEGRVRHELWPGRSEFNFSELIEEQHDLIGENLAAMIVDSHGQIVRQSERTIPSWPHPQPDSWRITTVIDGDDTLVIGLPWQATESALRQQALVLVTLGLILVLAAGIGAWLLVGRTLSPIRRLTLQAHAASTEQMQVRLSAPSNDAEITALVATLNELLARLADTAAAKGRFYAAASHELRTPLQILSGNLELARMRSRTAEEYREIVDEAYDQTHRLTSLVRSLLLLNQLDSAQPLPEERVDVASLCEGTLDHLKSITEAKGLQVSTELPLLSELSASSSYVEMLVRNLIENAIKYARPEGKVRIQFSADGGRLSVFNECAPIANWDQERLFEPFYRPDSSRNSKSGGNGLGLAICKAICTANHWALSLNQVAGGVSAVVNFDSLESEI